METEQWYQGKNMVTVSRTLKSLGVTPDIIEDVTVTFGEQSFCVSLRGMVGSQH